MIILKVEIKIISVTIKTLSKSIKKYNGNLYILKITFVS